MLYKTRVIRANSINVLCIVFKQQLMKYLFILFGVLLFVSLGFAEKDAECAAACQADFDKWEKINKGVYDAKSYYCGVTETNCWSRTTTPSGQPDPCWSICTSCTDSKQECNNKFQDCCDESAGINNQAGLEGCLANCPDKTVETPPANKCEQKQCRFYQVQAPYPDCECKAPLNILEEQHRMRVKSIKGTVWIRKLGETNKQLLTTSTIFEVGDSIATSEDGEVELEKDLPNGGTHVERLGRLQTIKSIIHCNYEPCTAGSIASSEHSSIRGTLNGGGDFIFILLPLRPLTVGLSPFTLVSGKTPVMQVYEKSTDETHESVFLQFPADNDDSTKLIEIRPTMSETEYYLTESTLRTTADVTVIKGELNVGPINEDKYNINTGQTVTASETGVTQQDTENPPQPKPTNCLGTTAIIALALTTAYITHKCKNN